MVAQFPLISLDRIHQIRFLVRIQYTPTIRNDGFYFSVALTSLSGRGKTHYPPVPSPITPLSSCVYSDKILGSALALWAHVEMQWTVSYHFSSERSSFTQHEVINESVRPCAMSVHSYRIWPLPSGSGHIRVRHLPFRCIQGCLRRLVVRIAF
jgi:hypothetical protein